MIEKIVHSRYICIVAALALMLSASSHNAYTGERSTSTDVNADREKKKIKNTKEMINHLQLKYNLAETDDLLTKLTVKAGASSYYPSEEEKNDYFLFLRSAILKYDNYAEELFWCWKERRCHPATMRHHCSTFSSLVNQLTAVDKMATRDPLKREVDALIGEDEPQNHIPLQMPNVSLYLTNICRDYRYQSHFLPSGRYHRQE